MYEDTSGASESSEGIVDHNPFGDTAIDNHYDKNVVKQMYKQKTLKKEKEEQ